MAEEHLIIKALLETLLDLNPDIDYECGITNDSGDQFSVEYIQEVINGERA